MSSVIRELLEKISEMIQSFGPSGYVTVAAFIMLWLVASISGFLVIPMLIYSFFSRNWRIWKKWKYIGYVALVGVGLYVLGVVIRVIQGYLV